MSSKSEVSKIFKDARTDFRKANQAALNRSFKSAFSQTSKFIRQTYNIKKSDLDSLAVKVPATINNPYAKIIISHKAIQASKFTPIVQGWGGTRFREKLGNSKFVPHAFILKLKGVDSSGGDYTHTGITFARYVSGHGKNRKYKWKTVWGPSGEQLLGSKISLDYMDNCFDEIFPKEFAAASDHFIK